VKPMFLSLVLAATLSACASTPQVASDFDASANFASYQSYSWVRGGPQSGTNALLHQRVQDAIDAELARRGYSRVDSASAQFAIDFTLGSRDRVETSDFGDFGPYYPAYGRAYRYGWARPYSAPEIETVTDGTLIVDIYDARSKRPVWNGRATREISSSSISDSDIATAVAAVLAKFPPTPKS